MDRARLTLIDSSAWIEFWRATGSSVNVRVRELIDSGAGLVTTEPVWMELLAGARGAAERFQVRRALSGCRTFPVQGPADWEDAAAIFVTCREAGFTPREQIDCLIAAVAIRARVPVLAKDRDYQAIAEHSGLQLAQR